jgi:hypothetical protein
LNQIPELIDSALKCMKKYFDEYQQLARTRTSVASLSQQSCEHNINVSSPIARKRKLEEEFAYTSHAGGIHGPKNQNWIYTWKKRMNWTVKTLIYWLGRR